MPPQTPADPLARALDAAIAGDPSALQGLLTRGSRLPGTRMNNHLADAFAESCRTHGPRADAVAFALARLGADEAPGATAREFLPVCGVYALAARAAASSGGGASSNNASSTGARVRARVLAELHARADDLRFRVRDAVVEALSRIGAAAGDVLVGEVAPWMDGYFHAAAVVRALASPAWLGAVRDAGGVVSRLDEAFALVRDAPRAAARWPGHKALVDALGESPAAIAATLGVPVFDMLVGWSTARDPVLREVVARAIGSRKLAARFGPEVDRVSRALDASRPAPRNPDHDVGPTRDRSGHRRRGRR
jgi:hypothetical protein